MFFGRIEKLIITFAEKNMGTIKVIARDCGLSRSEMKYLSNRFNCRQKKERMIPSATQE